MTLMRGRGVIIPVEWDENGNVVAIGISTHEEDEYIVEDGGKGTELKDLVRQEVEVFGEVKRINPNVAEIFGPKALRSLYIFHIYINLNWSIIS